MSSQANPTVISTFSGCGGSSLGYQMAGYRELLAVEWDKKAVETFALNFPDIPVYYGDIAQLTVEECLRLARLGPGELDILDGSPPCQGFSTSGRREFADNRNQLYREYVRLLRGLQPRAFIMENVSGLIKGAMRLIFRDMLRAMKESGYQVRARLLNAMWFGVPQSRARVIFIGVRNDLATEPSFPKPQTRPQTARAAISDLPIDTDEREMLLAAGQKYVAYQDWPRIRLGRSRQSLGLSGFNCYRWSPNRPAQTIRRNDGFISMHGAMHWAEQRRFTVGEFKRFSSFPDSFKFAGTWKDAVSQIGNSVPPLFIKVIAAHIRQEILGYVS